ncbi:MAG: methylated-DNA--[protein]-cysteine S-methyltransferase [Oscillospiraceae bacterium]|nr:methylated-DNA--[protein]-cysteine S-methyltransferase [Oscillospiraceae bacterium]
MHYFTTYDSPLGLITLASDGESLIGLWLDGQKYHSASMSEDKSKRDDLPIFALAKNWLSRYFDGEKPSVSELPLAPIGSAFRQDVWRVLCAIPYGEIVTYGNIAAQVAPDGSKSGSYSRAVGGAVGHNPISIIIPCHRVIGSSGSLTGYAGGVDKKVFLLELEGIKGDMA